MATMIPLTALAYRIDRFGGPEVASFATVEVPKPGPGELLVRVRAASINPVDYKLREGKFPPVGEDKLPYTIGRDLCGDVVALGAATSGFHEGDTIYAQLGVDRGSLAEYVVVKQAEASPKPASLDNTTAGAVPLAGLTAWQGLFTHGGLKVGQRVLIHAGAGGVGHLAIQFAKAIGAYVITTVSTDNLDFARQLGADVVIDHKTERFEDKATDIDLVFDLVGGETRDRSFGVLKGGGIMVSTLGEPSQDQARAAGVRVAGYMAQPDAANLRQITELIDAGKVKVTVSKTFAFKDAGAAMQAVEDGHTIGKVVVNVG